MKMTVVIVGTSIVNQEYERKKSKSNEFSADKIERMLEEGQDEDNQSRRRNNERIVIIRILNALKIILAQNVLLIYYLIKT